MTAFVREILGGPSESGQTKVVVEIRFRDPPEPPELDFDHLISAWYTVGFHGGYEGVKLHQLNGLTVDATSARFTAVVGGDPWGALHVLERCLREIEDDDSATFESATTRETTYRR